MKSYDEKTALLVIHPHREYDHGVTEQNIVETAEQFDGDVYFVPDTSPSERLRTGELENLYDGYDFLLTGETAGELEEDTITEHLNGVYDEVLLGGGYAGECLRNAHRSLLEHGDMEVSVLPHITFDQQFRVTEGEEDTRRYTLADAWSETGLVEKVLKEFEGAFEGRVKTRMQV